MKLNTPLPQPLPKECIKAAKIFRSFVDGGNNGLDGVVPREVLDNCKGLAIFSVVKAGFIFSARAGSGIVVARLEDGAWSAPTAIGTAGLGVGGQLGAEVTDFLIVLNSRSAVRSFMAAGSLTLGGNMSLAIGPIGRNGEAMGSLTSGGKVAAMYSYSKTRGLFGGLSIEGSVIVERQDANQLAYHADHTAKQLLSGAVPPPDWARPLINTLESCTGLPGNRKWVKDQMESRKEGGYVFGSGSPGVLSSPRDEGAPSSRKIRKERKPSFPPASWSQDSTGFASQFDRTPPPARDSTSYFGGDVTTPKKDQSTSAFETQFNSDFVAGETTASPKSPVFPSSHSYRPNSFEELRGRTSEEFGGQQQQQNGGGHSRSMSVMNPRAATFAHTRTFSHANDFQPMSPNLYGSPTSYSAASPQASGGYQAPSPTGLTTSSSRSSFTGTPKPYLAPKPELVKPLASDEVGRAIALFDFSAAESGDLSFPKGAVISIIQKSQSTDDWWKGRLDGREGIFPANFVEVV